MIDNTLIQIILYITAAINAILAFVIFSRGVREYKNLIFGLIALTAAAWTVAIVWFYFPPPNFRADINWVAYTHSSALIIAVLFLYFSLAFPRNLLAKTNYLLVVPVAVLSYFLTIIFTTSLVIGSAEGLTYTLGVAYPAYAIALSGGFFVGYYFLFLQFKRAKNDLQKKQIRYVAIGSVTASTLAIIPNLIFPYVGIFNLTWTGPLFTLLMVISIFSAMVRVHLFNIKIIATEIFTGIILLTLLAQLFVAQSILTLSITTVSLILVSVSAFLLIRSVYREVEQREEIERLAQNLKAANEKLKELDKLKNQFLSIASHDLRAPLTAIRNFMSLLLDGTYGKLPEAAEEGAHEVFERSTGMANMVDNYLNVSRIEQGKMKYDFSPTDVGEIVNSTAQAFAPVLREKGLAFDYERINEAITVRADGAKLREVFENLLNNALHYTKEGSVAIFVEKRYDVLRVTFQDSGIGMTEDVIKNKLFKLFSTADDSRALNPKSSGVGLYISKAHIEAHKGKIWAESDGVGKGSRFIVELPLV